MLDGLDHEVLVWRAFAGVREERHNGRVVAGALRPDLASAGGLAQHCTGRADARRKVGWGTWEVAAGAPARPP
eukprot:14673713-Alexandrium_andersonii.AAC.1